MPNDGQIGLFELWAIAPHTPSPCRLWSLPSPLLCVCSLIERDIFTNVLYSDCGTTVHFPPIIDYAVCSTLFTNKIRMKYEVIDPINPHTFYEALFVKWGCRQKKWNHITEENLELPYMPLSMGRQCNCKELIKYAYRMWFVPGQCLVQTSRHCLEVCLGLPK